MAHYLLRNSAQSLLASVDCRRPREARSGLDLLVAVVSLRQSTNAGRDFATSNKKKERKRVTTCIFRASLVGARHYRKRDVYVAARSDWLVRCKGCRLR